MTDVFEQLSRLLAGDLPEDEVAHWHQRIQDEPDIAQAWRELTALTQQLNALPQTLSGPPPIPVPAPRPANRPWLPIALGVAVAAAVAWMVLPSAPGSTTLALGSGVHAIDGQASVHVMGVQIDVDGRAAISVEPAADLPRVDLAEDPMNALTHAAALATGAIITVTVYEGTASVRQPDTPSAQVVTPGTPLTLGTPEAAPAQAATPSTRPERIDAARLDDIATLRQAVAQLQDENDVLRMQATFAEGQLAAIEGEPVAWPSSPHPKMQPDAFTAAIEAAVMDIPNAALLEVDCDEYPCIAHIDIPPEHIDALPTLIDPLSDAIAGEEDDPGMMVLVNETDDGTGPTTTMSVALSEDAGEGPDPRIEQRTRNFTDGMRN